MSVSDVRRLPNRPDAPDLGDMTCSGGLSEGKKQTIFYTPDPSEIVPHMLTFDVEHTWWQICR